MCLCLSLCLFLSLSVSLFLPVSLFLSLSPRHRHTQTHTHKNVAQKQKEDCVGSTRLAVMVIKDGGVEGRNRSGEHGQIKDVLTETVFMRHTQYV